MAERNILLEKHQNYDIWEIREEKMLKLILVGPSFARDCFSLEYLFETPVPHRMAPSCVGKICSELFTTSCSIIAF